MDNFDYDVVIVGAGPSGLFTAYKLITKNYKGKILIVEKGKELKNRHCPIKTNNLNKCLNCKPCAISSGFGGAGAFSDGKFNITNDFGGIIWEKMGSEKSLQLQKEVDDINHELYCKAKNESFENTTYPKLYSSKNSNFHKLCTQNRLHLLDADIRHLGTDNNYLILAQLYRILLDNKVQFLFNKEITDIEPNNSHYIVSIIDNNGQHLKQISARYLIVATGRSGSKWIEFICEKLNIETTSNRVDMGVRVELPYEVFSDLTDNLYESKIIYKTKNYENECRSFCMNPKGEVVTENTNGIITVNGHSFEDKTKQTNNTNFALLVTETLSEPFNNSNYYGESFATISNVLNGGITVQRFGDIIQYHRTTKEDLVKNYVKPTLKATPGDLSLILPKRILDSIIETIYAFDKIAPGTANDDTLLYGVEVKFYNCKVKLDNNFQALPNMYVIGDCSGYTHSLSQASALGLFVAEKILNE